MILDQTFPKSKRLLNSKDYSPVFDNAIYKASNGQFLMLAIPNQKNHARIGLVVAKKNVKLAVQRNRIKRILRESFRLNQHLPAIDIVVLTRPKIDQLDNNSLQSSCEKLFNKLIQKEKQQQQG